jgi:iron complex transport system substrate-binding protein
MPGFASLSIASALSVASLNLCSDEYLLLLARPGEVVSVTRLAQDPKESPLWRIARPYSANRGTLEDIVALRPTLLLTMGGSGRSTGLIARRMGMKVVNLPFPATIDDVAANLRRTAAALGDPRRADPWIARIQRLRARAPRHATDAIFLSGGGVSLYPNSPGIEWMRLAGLAQRRLPNGRADLELLATRPPALVLRSDYRSKQMSAGQRWLDHPIVSRLKSLNTDGRAWTCAGPLMIEETRRLQGLRR